MSNWELHFPLITLPSLQENYRPAPRCLWCEFVQVHKEFPEIEKKENSATGAATAI
jgi:hypothetical protein